MCKGLSGTMPKHSTLGRVRSTDSRLRRRPAWDGGQNTCERWQVVPKLGKSYVFFFFFALFFVVLVGLFGVGYTREKKCVCVWLRVNKTAESDFPQLSWGKHEKETSKATRRCYDEPCVRGFLCLFCCVLVGRLTSKVTLLGVARHGQSGKRCACPWGMKGW